MNLYILDTDHLSLHQRGYRPLWGHLNRIPKEQLAITVVTAEEQLRGRFLQISQARSDTGLSEAYRHLRETIGKLNEFKILDYDVAASRIFAALRQQKIRIGTADLRIAAIALNAQAILVTRNHIHFSQIPGLLIEDWTA